MIQKSQNALSTQYDNATSGLTSVNVKEAIDELNTKVGNTSKGFIFASYGGNANSGRYLEFFPSIDSSLAPLYSTSALSVVEIVSRSTASSTCTIGFYNGATLLYTTTFTAQTQVINSGNPLFTLPSTGSLSIKVDSGSITKPHIYFIAKGA